MRTALALSLLAIAAGAGAPGAAPAPAPRRDAGPLPPPGSALRPAAEHCECLVAKAEGQVADALIVLGGAASAPPRPPPPACAKVPGLPSIPGTPVFPQPKAADVQDKPLADLLRALQKEKLAWKVNVLEGGFTTVEHGATAAMQELGKNPPKTAKESKEFLKKADALQRQMALAELLRGRLGPLSMAFIQANGAMQACNMMATGGATQLAITEKYPAEGYVIEAEKENVKRLVTGAKKANLLAAGATGLVATVQAVSAGADPKLVADTQAAVALVVPEQVTATPEELKAVDDAARAAAAKFDAELQNWTAAEMERLKAMGVTPGQPPGGGGAGPFALLGALLSGDVGALAKGAGDLFPPDSPVRAGLEGVAAITRGDYKTAILSATKLVPASTPLGAALATVRAVVP